MVEHGRQRSDARIQRFEQARAILGKHANGMTGQMTMNGVEKGELGRAVVGGAAQRPRHCLVPPIFVAWRCCLGEGHGVRVIRPGAVGQNGFHDLLTFFRGSIARAGAS
jgi:hypothetical protein